VLARVRLHFHLLEYPRWASLRVPRGALADILRGFLAASTVRLLSFDDAFSWAEVIENETLKDVTQIREGNVPITVDRAK
jgi:hypothetical protein